MWPLKDICRGAALGEQGVDLSVMRRNMVCGLLALTFLTALPADAKNPWGLIDPTQPPYNADQSGQTDSSGAFQAALSQIASWGKGVINIRLDNIV